MYVSYDLWFPLMHLDIMLCDVVSYFFLDAHVDLMFIIIVMD